VWSDLLAFFREPSPERPNEPSRLDRFLVFALVPAVIAEGLFAEPTAMHPLVIAVGVVGVVTIRFRRTHPAWATAVAFGLASAATLVGLLLRRPPSPLHTTACVLLLPYSLFRWGSGREIVAGMPFVAGAYAASALAGEMHEAGDYIGAAVVLLFPGALGASLRFRAESHRRDIEHAKLLERTQIARDLHDTVAHHVSAIALQAQGGRAVMARRPELAAQALEAIDKEASRTLAELRSIVSALRDDTGAPLEPGKTIADIARLAETARAVDSAALVDVEIVEGLGRLRPALQSALYRIAQEAITNAVRHARGATRIRVRVTAEGGKVQLLVDDDGSPPASARSPSGMGLVGMAERAALLGGTLEAGPRDDAAGWRVAAVLPENGKSS